MRDWASSGRVKIDRAKKHIRDLEGAITAFKGERPYPIFPNENPNDNLAAFRDHFNTFTVLPFVVRTDRQVPTDFTAIAADAVHNLHVALDHLWRQIVYKTPRHADLFPAFENPESAEARFSGKEHGRVRTAVDILKLADAFRAGNPFWDIRCFDDADKHDRLAFVACVPTGMDVVLESIDRLPSVNGVTTYAPFRWIFERRQESEITLADGNALSILENGTQLYALCPDPAQVNVEHQVAFEIAFADGEVLKGQPVLPTIKNMAQAVDSLAHAFLTTGLLK